MAIDTSSAPPGSFTPAPPAEPPKQPKKVTLLVAILIGVVALIVGAGIGYAAGIPQRNDLSSQKQTAIRQRDAAAAQVNSLQGDVKSLQGDVTKANAATDKCKTAATDAADLEKQWQNLFFTDLADLANSTGDTTALEQHMDQQLQQMGDQASTVEDETTACQSAAG